jgi:hypothetical protein
VDLRRVLGLQLSKLPIAKERLCGSAVGPNSRGSPVARRSPKFRFASDLATRQSDRCRARVIIPTKASKYPNLSQPAVSGQIRMLETQIGRDLFTRTSRGIIPTAAAHELARSSGPHIDALELSGETAQISDYEGTVHLGGPIEFLTERVLPSLSQLIRNGLGFRVTVASPDELIDQLSKHTIDLAVSGVKITKSGGD